MITRKTAFDIALCYEEIEKGEKLLAQLKEQLSRPESNNRVDSFGRSRKLQLGIPNGDSSQRLLDVSPRIAIQVIDEHVRLTRALLSSLNSQAATEALTTDKPA